MKIGSFRTRILALALALALPALALAQDARRIPLPKPQLDRGMSLMRALLERKSQRAFSPDPLPAQVLSTMLWAAFGINRGSSGKRTAPSAVNFQETDVYLATAAGLYLYHAGSHSLDLVLAEDIRALTGTQSFVQTAPVNLIYVADFSKMGTYSEDVKEFLSAADGGFISQNVYLYCASEGLATVVRSLIDRDALAAAMGLSEDQRVILAQSVGYPSSNRGENNEQ